MVTTPGEQYQAWKDRQNSAPSGYMYARCLACGLVFQSVLAPMGYVTIPPQFQRELDSQHVH